MTMRVLVVALLLALVPSPATASPGYLDLPLVNANGELAGGVHPALPVERAVLERELAEVRKANIEPKRYAALLWQYWLVRACEDAGISLRDWDPARGAEANKETVVAAYVYYGKVFLDHRELKWPGLGNLAGPVFAAGMLDLGALPNLVALISTAVAAVPDEFKAALPRPLRVIGTVTISAVDLRWFETMLLSMQKHIFMDLGALHAAHLEGGVEEMRAAGLTDVTSMDSVELSDREQNRVIAEQWDRLRQHNFPVGEVLTYVMTFAGPMPVPGGRTPTQYAPLTVSAGCARLSTPMPAFNIADREARWDYFSNDTLPAYHRLDSAELVNLVETPVGERIARNRLAVRLPVLMASLLTGWRVHPCGDRLTSN